MHVTRVAVDASKFTPSNNGAWLAPLTCVGGDNTGKFTTAAHIRSIRFDFEKSPKEVLTRARTHPDDRENDTMSSYMGRDDGHMLYDVDEWRFLASHVMDDVVYIASDNAPARDELAMRIADGGGTACFVARTSGHSSWHWGGGRRPRPDGLVVSSASSNHPPDRFAVPRPDRALVPVQSQKMSERLGQARPQQRRDGPLSWVLLLARGAPALRGYSNAGPHVR